MSLRDWESEPQIVQENMTSFFIIATWPRPVAKLTGKLFKLLKKEQNNISSQPFLSVQFNSVKYIYMIVQEILQN